MHDWVTKRFGEVSEKQELRYWSKVKIVPTIDPEAQCGTPENACWPWMASLNTYGYGQFGLDGERRAVRAPRLSFFFSYGADPYPCDICHLCDVVMGKASRACCNPNHMFLGSRRDNIADREAKGRTAFGAALPQTRMFDEQVKVVLERRAKGESFAVIGKDYEMTPSGIFYAVKRYLKRSSLDKC